MASADTTTGRRERPLSPHLSIYRPIVTMVMSIMHRVTGIMNIGGLVLVVAYLLAIASGPEGYAWGNAIYSSWLARIVLVAFTWSLIHHMFGGFRHFVWDMGKGTGEERYSMSWATIVGSILVTTALWALIVVVEAI